MSGVLRWAGRELVIILALWLGGWCLAFSGGWGMKTAKGFYWSEKIATSLEYQKLSQKERDTAHLQFMTSGSIGVWDAPLRDGGWLMRISYAGEVLGDWLKGAWPLLYGIVVCVRGIRRLKRWQDRSAFVRISWLGELRIVGGILLGGLIWYASWGLLFPSLYVAYNRFCLRSFDYLWNARVSDFQRLAEAWPYILILYPVLVLVRAWRGGFAAGKSR